MRAFQSGWSAKATRKRDTHRLSPSGRLRRWHWPLPDCLLDNIREFGEIAVDREESQWESTSPHVSASSAEKTDEALLRGKTNCLGLALLGGRLFEGLPRLDSRPLPRGYTLLGEDAFQAFLTVDPQPLRDRSVH